MRQAELSRVPSVSLINDRPATTSLAIAESFGKRHDHVVRSIQDLIYNTPESFSAPNFGAAEYTDERGKPRPMFTVYFDGFILLVMGYTGKKALNMKLAYIAAFNAMREQLENQSLQKMQQLPASDSPITPDQQCTLQAIIRAKIEALSEDERKGRGLYPQIWSRFNNHFRIARYCQLPQSRLSEAIEYLTRMDLAPALPASAPLPAPKQDNVPAVREKTYREQCAEVTARVLALRNELFSVSDDMTEAFRRPFWGTGIPDDKKPFASAMNYAVQSLYMAVNKDLEAIQLLFTAYVEGESILNKGNGPKFA